MPGAATAFRTVLLCLLITSALIATPDPSTATTMVVDMNAPAHGARCRFSDRWIATLLKYDSENYYTLSLDRGAANQIGVIDRFHGQWEAVYTIPVNSETPAPRSAFTRLFHYMVGLPSHAIARGQMHDFLTQRRNLPTCRWRSVAALVASERPAPH